MRKKLITFIAFLISVCFIFSSFMGCNIVTTNNERDMKQVVATVKISDAENARKDEITKRDLIMLYMNYGYYYVQQMDYTYERVFNILLDNLISSKILLQYVLIEKGAETSAEENAWDAVTYLSEDQKIEAEYNTIKSMNNLIDGYEVKENVKKYETFGGDVRTVPENAAKEEVTVAEMTAYVNKYGEHGADVGAAGSTRYKAYNKLLKYLDVNKLLGDAKTLKDSEYYDLTLKNNQESLFIEDYEHGYQTAMRKEITFANLAAAYSEMYAAQKNDIYDVAAFESAIESASATNPVVYTPYTGYVYVYNLLLGANDNQTALIGKLDKDKLTDDEYYDARNIILKSTTVKDLRSSWILSGYDFDYATLKFTGDYAFLEDSIPFKGTVELVNDAEKVAAKEEDAVYRVTDTKEFGLNEFIEFMNGYVYSAAVTEKPATDKYIYKIYDMDDSKVNADFDARINELLFAFSTDSGSLNTYKGYLVSPEPEIGGSETYVKEFANAGRLFLTENLGNKSCIIVATDYGYHVMFFSEALNANTDYETLVEYLNAIESKSFNAEKWQEELTALIENWYNDDTDTTSYLYTITDLISDASNKLSRKEDEIVNKYKNDDKRVVRYTERYKDLLEM